MKGKKIISALQHIDPELIEEALEAPAATKRKSTFRFSTLIAACLCLVCSLSAVWMAFKWRSDPQGDIVITATGDPCVVGTEPGMAGDEGDIIETGATDVGEENTEAYDGSSEMRIALIGQGLFAHYGNSTAYNACRRYCEENPWAECCYYRPVEETVESYIETIDQVVLEGNNILVFASADAFADVIAETAMEVADLYPEIYFIIFGVSTECLRDGYTIPQNVCYITYREEIAGFMAGVAAVKLGYTKLGFLGFESNPRVDRYGYGFVQGADYAAGLTGATVEMKYAYANSVYSDAELTDYVFAWYSEGTEVVFSCGTEIIYSVAEAAAQVGAKVIEVDLEHSTETAMVYGEGITLTATVEELDRTVFDVLTAFYEGNWTNYGGLCLRLGLNSATDPEENYISLSDYTQFAHGFTYEDYTALVEDLLNGVLYVSDDIDTRPTTTYITVDYRDPFK